MVKKKTTKADLSQIYSNADTWVEDRIDHNEPLQYNNFRSFMIGMGFKGKDVDKQKKRMQREYKRIK